MISIARCAACGADATYETANYLMCEPCLERFEAKMRQIREGPYDWSESGDRLRNEA